jgi:MoxR-like ATPase
MSAPADDPAAHWPDAPSLTTRLKEVARVLASHFLDKEEIIRLLLVAAVAGEHMILIGPPGTAKSAMVRMLSRLFDARYFEYLLTRFTEPNELFGPVDIRAFREGAYRRRTENMLPEAEIVFLDEIFKSNSAILNSLLTLLNERRFQSGTQRIDVPLISLYAASNEVPSDENLAAVFDRFLLRVVSNNLDSYHFHNLISVGLKNEIEDLRGGGGGVRPIVSARELTGLRRALHGRLRFGEDFLARYKGLVFQIRSEGISLSDRRVVKLLKLFAASALLDGREEADEGDFFILKHIWNSQEQIDLLEEIVTPVLDRYYREHPEQRRGGGVATLDALLQELGRIRELLTSGQALSDLQLFAQLKSLGEIRATLSTMESETSRRMVGEIDALLESVFSSSKFG